MRVIAYKRHKKDCPHKKNKSYRRCDCAIWLEITTAINIGNRARRLIGTLSRKRPAN
jgi:hypothetical protein